jgi:hypothetical protein
MTATGFGDLEDVSVSVVSLAQDLRPANTGLDWKLEGDAGAAWGELDSNHFTDLAAKHPTETTHYQILRRITQ